MGYRFVFVRYFYFFFCRWVFIMWDIFYGGLKGGLVVVGVFYIGRLVGSGSYVFVFVIFFIWLGRLGFRVVNLKLG